MPTLTRKHGPQIVVRANCIDRQRGVISLGPLSFPCALGRSGIRLIKREGDGATPKGRFRIDKVFYNPSRLSRPRSVLPIAALHPRDGWCDAPNDRNYNRKIRHPYPASAERLWRGDALYDVVVVLDHNQRPRLRGRGSAIFIHVAREKYQPTEGCVALCRDDLLKLLARIPQHRRITIA